MKKQETTKKQGTEVVEPAGDLAVAKSADIKPRVRKKKAAETTESEIVASAAPQVEPEVVKAKSAKKAVKKATPAKTENEAPAPEQPVEAAAETPKTIKAPAKKSAKVSKKDKGRDLVVDEPGAREVAEVLHHTNEDEEPAGDAAGTADIKGPEPKLERLQKILAKAGISSRRKAEELIVGGRVQINGKVVMELGTKADPARDHVRVDGKLLQGPERIRYFVLNKPKGFVTTVSDPEGRPTVMQFFSTEHERLYPVGRLDYLSEGLLLVTNDGELANKLTKAASGVEKTYLVKVAGQPSEEGLEALRSGVVIERGRGIGSGRVRTAPAQIRQVRQGDNPWYEVIIIEGRNRELRKMFEEIGHHVEKIRRVGYGPLVLDLEPGKLRELEPEEVHSLRLAAEGKLKTRRKRGSAAGQLPTVAGKTVRYKKADGKPGFERPSAPAFKKEFKPTEKRAVRPEFQQESKGDFNPTFRPDSRRESKPEFKREAKPEFKPAGRTEFRADSGSRTGSSDRQGGRPSTRPSSGPSTRSSSGSGFKPGFKAGGRPAFGAKQRTNRPAEPPVTEYVLPPRKAGPPEPEFDDRASKPKSEFNPDYKPGFRTGAKPAFRSDRPGSKPAFRADGPPKRFGTGSPDSRPSSRGPAREDAKPFRSAPPRADFARPKPATDESDFAPAKTPGFRIEPVEDKPRAERPRSGGFDRAGGGGKPFRPTGGRPAGGDRPFRPRADGPPSGDRSFRPGVNRSPGRSSDRNPGQSPDRGSDRPAGPARPFRPRSGGPPTGRASGPAAGGRPFRPSARPDSRGGSERPPRFTPRTDGPPARRTKSFGTSDDRPREFRPRTGDGPPKKFAGAKPATGGRPRTGPGGEPRVKERWRNSFTGKNKGRPKPKGKSDE